jgi:Fur family peroxide stress response transcriptional regulator
MVANPIKRPRPEPSPGSGPSGGIALWCRRFEDLCRQRGIRVTAQRMAVYQALAQDSTHPTADAIHARLRSGLSSLSPATVYRILEFLEREGLVRKVSTTEGAGRFDAKIGEHQHLVCRVCGSMVDFEPALPVRIELPKIGIRGFVAEDFDVRIVGTCRQCRSAPPQARRGGAGNNK